MSGGSSLWGWHGGDCAWARGRGVWRQGGAWVCGEKKVASAEVSRREGPDPGHQTHSRAWHAMDGDESAPDGQLPFPSALSCHTLGELLHP